MNAALLSTGTLLQREIVRFLRQKDRVLGAFATPVLFWLLIGSGLGRSFHVPGTGPSGFGAGGLTYLDYFFPGTVVLILLFTAIFSTISVIEDRQAGFLQGVLVSPAPRSSIVLGKILGGTVLAFGQALVLLLALPFLGTSFQWGNLAAVCPVLLVLSFALTAMGFVFAWRLDSTQGFHAVMNLFMIPLWLLSGALFPPAGAPAWLRGLMRLNPLTYGVAALHRTLFPGTGAGAGWPSIGACLSVTLLFAGIMWLLAEAVARRSDRAR